MKDRVRWLLPVLLLLTAIAALLPASALAELRYSVPWFSRLISRIERIPLPLDMTHVLLFALVGGVVGLGVYWSRRWLVGAWLVLVGIAAATELVQLVVPGRRPSWPDFRDDVIGACVGLLLAILLRWLWRQIVRQPGTVQHPADPVQKWLSDVLRGVAPDSSPVSGVGCAQVQAVTVAEKVSALTQQRLSEWKPLPESLQPLLSSLTAGARETAARSLLRQSEARRVGAALAAAGVDHLWLKGIALAAWLYPAPHLREMEDLDLLFATQGDAMRAAEALVPLGYALPLRNIAGDLYVYELLAWNDSRRLELDLHWGLDNTALFARRFDWRELRAEACPLDALGSGAFGLSPVHALLHACMHRACNLRTGHGDRLQWLYDLHLLVGALGDDDWRRVSELSKDRRLADVCLDGLRASVVAFATPVPSTVMQDLASIAKSESLRTARLSRWSYFQWRSMLELPGWRQRLRWLWQMLIGEPAHLRERYGDPAAAMPVLLWRRLRDGWRRLPRYSV